MDAFDQDAAHFIENCAVDAPASGLERVFKLQLPFPHPHTTDTH